MVDVFRAVHRVLRLDGTVWLNLGDSYAGGGRGGGSSGSKQQTNLGSLVPPSPLSGLKPKDLCGIPWRVAFALQADGWYLRQDIIWSKPNSMPESVTDRCTKSHEYIFLLSKNERYYYDDEAIKESGSLQKSGNTQHKYVNGQELHRTKSGFLEMRQKVYTKVNKRSVWTVTTNPFKEAHFATFPPMLINPMIKAGTSEKGCCAKCGAPWERCIVKSNESKQTTRGKQPWASETGQRDSAGGLPYRDTSTSGWQPTCDCNTEAIPCTVLDPFGGAGTVSY